MFDVDQPAVFYGGTRLNPKHRVWLRRKLSDEPVVRPYIFILHNPSIAGFTKNDPTATRGISFSLAGGATDMVFVNASTQIATDAKNLDPDELNCPWSDWALEAAVKMARDHDGKLIAAYGAPKGKAATQRKMFARFEEIQELCKGSLHYLRLTANGYPEHPLYLPNALKPVEWEY